MLVSTVPFSHGRVSRAFPGHYATEKAGARNPAIVNARETRTAATAPIIANTMPLLIPPPPTRPVRGDKRKLVVVALAAALLVAATVLWSAVYPDAYSRARSGCVTVTIPGPTGGALLHGCGPRAQIMCHRAFIQHDQLSLLARLPCRGAGLG